MAMEHGIICVGPLLWREFLYLSSFLYAAWQATGDEPQKAKRKKQHRP